MRLTLGGTEIELFTLPAVTHSPWDMFIRLPKEKYLLAGDNAVDLSLFFCGNSDLGSWPGTLRSLSRQGDENILPGHGDLCPIGYLQDMAAHIELISAIGQKIVYCLSERERREFSAQKAEILAEAYLASEEPDALLLRQRTGDAALAQVCQSIWYYLSETLN